MKTEQYDLPGEEFKWIEGWQNVYAISNLGRYKSFKRNKPYYSFGIKTPQGYMKLKIYEHGKLIAQPLMHDLVAEAFIRKFDKNTELVHHKSKIKTQNNVQNLKIETYKEHGSHHNKGKVWSQQSKNKLSNSRKELGLTIKLTPQIIKKRVASFKETIQLRKYTNN